MEKVYAAFSNPKYHYSPLLFIIHSNGLNGPTIKTMSTKLAGKELHTRDSHKQANPTKEQANKTDLPRKKEQITRRTIFP